MSETHVTVAVLGAGPTGIGWAALCASQGWPVTIFDNNAAATNAAPEQIAQRARNLVELGRANPEEVQEGIAQLEVAGSLLKATREAQWVIEAIDENLQHKQKLIEMIDSTSVRARVVSSSASSFKPADIAARTKFKKRCMIVHPSNPPELIPLVEIVPAPETDHTLVELMKGWLHALGRIGIVVHKPVPGHVTGRIAAAVWREAIDLVLKGIIDVDGLDRCVSLGPAVAWAAAGPHLSYRLAAEQRGFNAYLQVMLQSYEESWADMANWSHLDNDQRRKIIHAIDKTYEGKTEIIREARDRRLAGILKGLESSRKRPD